MARGKKREDRQAITELLKEKLKLGMSVTKACQSIGVPQQTVDQWIQDDPNLRLKVKVWQREIEDRAREVIDMKIREGDDDVAAWYLERKARDEFSTKVNVDEKSDQTISIIYNEPDQDN